jgi:amino acid adenylation domain-containing protein
MSDVVDFNALPPLQEGAGDVVSDLLATARQWPHRPAIVHDGIEITYGELAGSIRLTALRYRAGGFCTGASPHLIGAMVAHTPSAVEHLFGILLAGATYCPIDAAHPAARKQATAAALRLDRVVATASGQRGPATLRVETLDDSTIADQHLPESHPDDSAYVLCTSGSTGAPKPVVVSRGALAVTVQALRRLFALTPDDRVLQFASLGWDTCLEEILPALTAGATLVFDDAAHFGSFLPFVRMLAAREITVVDLPTAFWHELVHFLVEERTNLPDCVRLVVIGGERVDPTRLRQWRELDGGRATLLNTYGCTETTMITHAVRLHGPGTEPELTKPDAGAPLGRALPHVRDHVTDEGELLVAGPALATGYLGSAKLTAARFPVVDHGFGPVRWFRTGDVVTRDEFGLLHARGRVDEEVKVLGVRIHPAEVEAQLNTHPAVAGAVVVGERRLGRTALTAFVVPSGGTTAAELKRHLRERLPGQFVPSRIVFITALAHTASGKVDRAATLKAAANHHHEGASR